MKLLARDLMEGVYRGYKYVVRQIGDSDISWLCGYVILPENHKFFGVDYDELSIIKCPGGITFNGYLLDVDGGDSEVYAIGFDCMNRYGLDVNDVKAWCIHIIEQLESVALK